MQKVRIIIWVIISGFIGLVLFQNKVFFLEKQIFDIDLMIRQYHSPEIYNGALFLGCLLTGLLLSYFSTLLERFKAKKTIKYLNTQVATYNDKTESYNKKIASLESELASLQKRISADQQQPANEQSSQTINESSVSS
ncbi:MAG: hypothetical protein JRI32_09845 [Deltaproteobacteria bacterium]|nr:hypothetical protein [Deltaproteobacteria bacterium]